MGSQVMASSLLALAAVAAAGSKFNGSPRLHGERITSPRPHERMNVGDLVSDEWVAAGSRSDLEKVLH